MKNRDLRISAESRNNMTYNSAAFETTQSSVQMYRQAQDIAMLYNKCFKASVSAGDLHASAILHLIYQTVVSEYLKMSECNPFSRIAILAEKNNDCMEILNYYSYSFPSLVNQLSREEDPEGFTEETARAFFIYQVLMANPAIVKAMQEMIDPDNISFPVGTKALNGLLGSYLKGTDAGFSQDETLFDFLTRPSRLFPDSLLKQIEYILDNWQNYLTQEIRTLLLNAVDFLHEEQKPKFPSGPGPVQLQDFFGSGSYENQEIEAFSQDRSWMPNVVMMAKSTLVWLDQLSKKYSRNIDTLDKIPDEELDILRDRGFTALWLIGLWERSHASKKIKNLCGNPDAESSAYSLYGYTISGRLGGWNALNNLKTRCSMRGIRLASDMVPNHTGIDSDFLKNNSNYFVHQSYPPFPSYTYNGPNLSDDPSYDIRIEDHYYNRTDAAVAFRFKDNKTGETKYIFHGNDGTTMPWNDTAQLDFLNPDTREAVIKQILDVARAFPIIRFDAAMTLAKRHIQRLWYPKPGTAGDIAGRAIYSMSDEQFNKAIPVEFWREVVDRVAAELPDTLLLAEAFWMMEGYFVRTLGMHRVYNSAFMHMMKNEDNRRYIDSIKNTLLFDPEILKRYVNFMNNPDEETAFAQFGSMDKYFGVCTLLATMPGLPMFGHGQIEGFHEKYGMEYQRAYWDEKPDEGLIHGHELKIFPLLKMRHLFSGCTKFQLFDAQDNSGNTLDNVYAYVNGDDSGMALVLYNNSNTKVYANIKVSAPKLERKGNERSVRTTTLAESLLLSHGLFKYTIFKNFSDNLWYIVPSSNIFDEGMHTELNGYETKVLLEFREVYDCDGVYEKLYNSLGTNGTPDIDLEIRKLYLKPFFSVAEVLKKNRFLKDIRNILEGKSCQSARIAVMQDIGSCYAYLEELSSVTEKIGLKFRAVRASDILSLFKRLDNVCRIKLFTNGNIILRQYLSSVVAASVLLKPYIPDNCSMEEALSIANTVMIDSFFDVPAQYICRFVLLLCKPCSDVTKLLENNTFLKLIGVNEYQGIRWYKGEAFQECLYLYVLSIALRSKEEPDSRYYSRLLEKYLSKNSEAEYKFDNLLK